MQFLKNGFRRPFIYFSEYFIWLLFEVIKILCYVCDIWIRLRMLIIITSIIKYSFDQSATDFKFGKDYGGAFVSIMYVAHDEKRSLS